jgi:FG-GAP repeat/WD40-like Beta Propeller Repeat
VGYFSNDKEDSGNFGYSLALSANGNRVVVGAPNDNDFSGSFYVQDWTGRDWTHVASMKGESGMGYSPFGTYIALSADGNRVAVGSGQYVQIYDWTAESQEWTQVGRDLMGITKSIALSADGDRLVISSPFGAETYDWTGSEWTKVGNIDFGFDEGGCFGDYRSSLALSFDGNRLATYAVKSENETGADRFVGHVRIYDWTGARWAMMGSDFDVASTSSFADGQMVALASDGNRVAFVGASFSGTFDDGKRRTLVGIYDWTKDQWEQVGPHLDDTGSGEATDDRIRATWSIALSSDGNRLAIAADRGSTNHRSLSWNFGHVIVYDWTGFQWIEASPSLSAAGDDVGDPAFETVALSSDGSRLVIGAIIPCRVRVYDDLQLVQE